MRNIKWYKYIKHTKFETLHSNIGREYALGLLDAI